MQRNDKEMSVVLKPQSCKFGSIGKWQCGMCLKLSNRNQFCNSKSISHDEVVDELACSKDGYDGLAFLAHLSR